MFWNTGFCGSSDKWLPNEFVLQVVDHAATIKQLQVADKAKTLLDNTIQNHIRAKAQAEAEKVFTRFLPSWTALRPPVAITCDGCVKGQEGQEGSFACI